MRPALGTPRRVLRAQGASLDSRRPLQKLRRATRRLRAPVKVQSSAASGITNLAKAPYTSRADVSTVFRIPILVLPIEMEQGSVNRGTDVHLSLDLSCCCGTVENDALSLTGMRLDAQSQEPTSALHTAASSRKIQRVAMLSRRRCF